MIVNYLKNNIIYVTTTINANHEVTLEDYQGSLNMIYIAGATVVADDLNDPSKAQIKLEYDATTNKYITSKVAKTFMIFSNYLYRYYFNGPTLILNLTLWIFGTSLVLLKLIRFIVIEQLLLLIVIPLIVVTDYSLKQLPIIINALIITLFEFMALMLSLKIFVVLNIAIEANSSDLLLNFLICIILCLLMIYGSDVILKYVNIKINNQLENQTLYK